MTDYDQQISNSRIGNMMEYKAALEMSVLSYNICIFETEIIFMINNNDTSENNNDDDEMPFHYMYYREL